MRCRRRAERTRLSADGGCNEDQDVLTFMSMAIAAGSAMANGQEDALRVIADQLRYVRSLAPDADVNLSCPEKSFLVQLQDVRRADVLAQLSEPDFKESDEDDSPWSYFLTKAGEEVVDEGEVIEVTAGGGFPTITFDFDQQGQVERVTCVYAR